MKLSGLIDALLAAGGTMEQVRALVAAAEAQDEAVAADRRAKAAAKKRRQRGSVSTVVPGTDGDVEGQSGRKKEDPQTPKEKTTPPSLPSEAHAPKGADRSRASRISPDWSLDDIGRAYAANQGLKPAEIDLQAERFRNHWLAESGVKGRKLDWPAAWRNWVLGHVERRPRAGPARAGPQRGFDFREPRNPHSAAFDRFLDREVP